MTRLATLALLAVLAVSASAQPGGPPPPPRGPGDPPRGGPGDDDRMRLHDQMRDIDGKLADIEKRFGDKNLSDKEEDALRAEAAELQAKRKAIEDQLRRMGPPPGGGPGPGQGPGQGDPRARELVLQLDKLETEIARLQAEKKFDEAKKLSIQAEKLRQDIQAMDDDRRPNGPPPPADPTASGPGFRPGGRGVALTTEDRDKALIWIKENEPVRFQRLNELREEKRQQEYDRAVTQVAMEIRELLQMQQADPERYARRLDQRKLEYRSNELADKIRGGESQNEKADREELKGILGKLFDLREADREQELKRLEEEMTRLKDTMKKRRDAKDQIVNRRLEELLGDEDIMKWDPQGPGPRPPEPPPPPKDNR